VLAVISYDFRLTVGHILEHVKVLIDAESISNKVLVGAKKIIILKLLFVLLRLFVDLVNELL
jgi:hypothetical protein